MYELVNISAMSCPLQYYYRAKKEAKAILQILPK